MACAELLLISCCTRMQAEKAEASVALLLSVEHVQPRLRSGLLLGILSWTAEQVSTCHASSTSAACSGPDRNCRNPSLQCVRRSGGWFWARHTQSSSSSADDSWRADYSVPPSKMSPAHWLRVRLRPNGTVQH